MATNLRNEGRILRLEARAAARVAVHAVAALNLRDLSDAALQAMMDQALSRSERSTPVDPASDLPGDDPVTLQALVGRYMAELTLSEQRACGA